MVVGLSSMPVVVALAATLVLFAEDVRAADSGGTDCDLVPPLHAATSFIPTASVGRRMAAVPDGRIRGDGGHRASRDRRVHLGHRAGAAALGRRDLVRRRRAQRPAAPQSRGPFGGVDGSRCGGRVRGRARGGGRLLPRAARPRKPRRRAPADPDGAGVVRAAAPSFRSRSTTPSVARARRMPTVRRTRTSTQTAMSPRRTLSRADTPTRPSRRPDCRARITRTCRSMDRARSTPWRASAT